MTTYSKTHTPQLFFFILIHTLLIYSPTLSSELNQTMKQQDQKNKLWSEDKKKLAKVLGIPKKLSVDVKSYKLYKEINLWDLDEFKELMEYQDENMKTSIHLNIYQIHYNAEYQIDGAKCKLAANTFLMVPKQLIESPVKSIPLTYISGSVSGLEAFLPQKYFQDRKKFMRESIEALGVFFHAYYFQAPVHIICKRGPEVKLEFSGEHHRQDTFGRLWTADYSAKLAALITLEKLGIPTSDKKHFVGGISAGGFRTLLLSAFDTSITHAFSVAGIFSFRSWVDAKGKSLSSYYGRADLLKKGIDIPDIIALCKSETVALFSMIDGEIRPRHFTVLKHANEKREMYGLDPIKLQIYHLEPNRRGHSWPRIEALNFFGNAAFP